MIKVKNVRQKCFFFLTEYFPVENPLNTFILRVLECCLTIGYSVAGGGVRFFCRYGDLSDTPVQSGELIGVL